MILHEIIYGGISTLGNLYAERQDMVRVRNDTDVTVTVKWPTDCFGSPASESVGAHQDSATRTIGASVPANSTYEITVEPDQPPPELELPETGTGNIHIVG